MPFAYYDRLSARDRAIYRASDTTPALALPRADELHPLVEALRRALGSEDRREVEVAVSLQVLAVRPSARWGELHGLYTRDDGRPPRIQLWMRTVRRRRVVAFRTFLRTLLHEMGHHVDYELLRLPDSFHTEGFFKRESSLFRQLVPEAPDAAVRTRKSPA
jgi:hypothetical protein